MSVGFTEKDLESIRQSLGGLSEKRRNHVLAVERMAERIGRIYTPDEDSILILRAAALLHDITKEYKVPEQVEVLRAHGAEPTEMELAVPKTFHAHTASLLIPDVFPEFNLPEIVSAVRWHTTGKADMSIYEKIIYFSDYIDDTRKFPECIRLRDMFWNPDPASMGEEEKQEHFRLSLIESFNITYSELVAENRPIDNLTNEARNYLIMNK